MTINLISDEQAISVVVHDNGIGSDYVFEESSEIEGFGLFSIRERLQHLGGLLKVESPDVGGLRVTLLLPFIHNHTTDNESNSGE